MRVSEIRVKRIRVNQGLGVVRKLQKKQSAAFCKTKKKNLVKQKSGFIVLELVTGGFL